MVALGNDKFSIPSNTLNPFQKIDDQRRLSFQLNSQMVNVDIAIGISV